MDKYFIPLDYNGARSLNSSHRFQLDGDKTLTALITVCKGLLAKILQEELCHYPGYVIVQVSEPGDTGTVLYTDYGQALRFCVLLEKGPHNERVEYRRIRIKTGNNFKRIRKQCEQMLEYWKMAANPRLRGYQIMETRYPGVPHRPDVVLHERFDT